MKLSNLSLEELMRLEVSTVSRKTELWWTAPGAIDVITNEDIRRAPVLNLPEALRLAVGLHVGQPSAREWAIAARGFNVTASNKLNVQMDGRSLFTPFFSGVTWNAQDTMLEDIDRIEVSRGPSGALWGAFAVNGFVQILTKPAWETQGSLASGAVGSELGWFSYRYGGKAGESTFYRVYAKYSQFNSTYSPVTGRRSMPTTDLAQTGFRLDSRGAADTTFTLHGDAYTNKGTPKDHLQNEIAGANLTGQMHRVLAPDSDVTVTGYYDYTSKDYAGTFREIRDTLAGSAKYRRATGTQELQVGVDGLVSWDNVTGPQLSFAPEKETFYTLSAFVHDTITLVPKRWTTTLGMQALYNGYSGADFQPTARVAWTPDSRTTIWGAVSRAVRPPVRADRDLIARFGTLLVFEGNNDLKSEDVVAYELGGRRRMGERFAVYFAGFLNRYNNLRSYEARNPPFMSFPWTFKNTTNAHSTGVEASALWQPVTRLFIKAHYRYLDLELTKDPGSGDFQNGLFEMNDPHHVAAITFRLDLPRHVELDATLRHVSSLPRPAIHAYTTADVRLGWSPRPDCEFSLIGQNLFDPRHPDFITPNSINDEVARSVTFKATWRF
jgi:iron complex outermembrane recepter protein